MRYRNRVFLLGNVGNDPEHLEKKDFAVATFSLYTSRTRQSKEGEAETFSERHMVKAYGPLAGIARDYVRKGALLDVEGSLHYDTYTGSDGVQRTATYVRAEEIILLPARANGHGDPEA